MRPDEPWWTFLMRITNNAPVTLAFFVISLILSILPIPEAMLAVHGPLRLSPNFVLTLFTYPFAHLDIRHFGGNLSMFLLLGPLLEERHGSRVFALILVATTLAIGLLHSALFPSAILGASGLVFMCITATSVTSARAGEIPVTLIAVCAAFLGTEIMEAITAHDRIAHSAHLLGGVVGVAFGLARRHMAGGGGKGRAPRR